MILYRQEDDIGELSFNDPERLNAMGEEMAEAMREQLGKLRRDGPRVLLLRGEGRAFSAGGDLAMLERKTHLGREENRRLMRAFYASFLDLLGLDVPLIAVLHGHAVGAGAVLACACDLRVAEPGTRIAFPFARLGLHPGMGATYFLPRLVGPGAARELLLTGVTVEADRALAMGLVNRVASPALAEARELARGLLQATPEALRDTLETLRGDPEELSRALEREARCQAESYGREEFRAALRSARQKRS